jgi:magnesium chelatase subunit D
VSVLKFPFSAVTGQASFKLALMLAAINPAIGGVLVSGPRGSAKSTLARGLADIMPAIEGKPHGFVTLPLGATEEMLLGTLNLQRVLDQQQVAFQPGILHKADGGVLYVDEVNLLPDNLVDLLLDVSASGVNIVERDGVSHSHDARFILLGTMNPDEGELRPQLQDRFGLSVQLDNQYSVDDRIEIVRLREAFDSDPEHFLAQCAQQQQALTLSIEEARTRLVQVQCHEQHRAMIAKRCQAAQVDGLRADIVWYRAALAHAALCQRCETHDEDVLAVEELVLGHRRNTSHPPERPEPPSSSYTRPPHRGQENKSESVQGDWGSMAPVQQNTLQERCNMPPMPTALLGVKASAVPDTLLNGAKAKGRTVGSRSWGWQASHKVNWFASLVASAGQWPLKGFRYRPLRQGQPCLHMVLLDTSASTLRNNLFAQAKGVILSIADGAYIKRDQLMILGFGNQTVETILPRRRAPKSLLRLLDSIPAAGGTPLRAILEHAFAYQKKLLKSTPEMALYTYLITDGRTTAPFDDLSLLGDVMVIDIEQAPVKRGKARKMADTLRARYWALPALAWA